MPTYHANLQDTEFPTIFNSDTASAQIAAEVMPTYTTTFERNPASANFQQTKFAMASSPGLRFRSKENRAGSGLEKRRPPSDSEKTDVPDLEKWSGPDPEKVEDPGLRKKGTVPI